MSTVLKAICVLAIISTVASQDCTLDLALDDSSPCSLNDLTDDVLEAVCLERGFELVQGEAQFSHEQYVEAATQCLELEVEMNKLLEENPDLLEAEAEEQRQEQDAAVLQAEIDAANTVIYNQDGAGPETPETVASVDDSPPHPTPPAPPAASDEVVEEIDLDESPPPAPPTPPATPNKSLGDLTKGNMVNPAGLSFKEFWDEFKTKVSSDANQLVNTIVPAPLREPLKGSVKTAMKVTKSVVTSVTSNAKRYITAFIEQKKQQLDEAKAAHQAQSA
ncbi:hypothetical protein TrLO_g5568 [Triparma laevis f. longispina]|uniref:Uncharacterized protein n=1 Tax=Triparma laevis f. longispina TaxID=1714387 RepID=A0A9W7E918_9STRA|nr:hypothetical protein TrLO_g5568 [Triparma laevis f. longispina]